MVPGMKTTQPTQEDRAAGGLLGLLVGDALGVPYEFRAASAIPPCSQIEYTPPAGYTPTYGQPPGTWSDDGAQALCLLASLVHCDRLDEADFAKRLVEWKDLGYMAVDAWVFDIGVTTRAAIENLKRGVDPLLSGLRDEDANGNGSLMRTLPVALWAAKKRAQKPTEESPEVTLADVVSMAHRASAVTHAHPRAMVCCALYCLVALHMLEDEGGDDPFMTCAAKLTAIYNTPRHPRTFAHELDSVMLHLGGFAGAVPSGTGYVVDSLHAARVLLLDCKSYEDAVRAAIALGNDTDTTAAIVGGLAGIRYGAKGIPSRWRLNLRGQDLLASFFAILDFFFEARS